MICARYGCDKHTTERLTVVNKDTKEENRFYLCHEHYMGLLRFIDLRRQIEEGELASK